MNIIRNKKGMNPLIITFVFIGIVIMIGVLILNFAVSTEGVDNCALTKIEVQRNFCISPEMEVKFKIYNDGVTVKNYLLNIVSDDIDLYSEEILGIKGKESKAYSVKVPFRGYLEIIPILDDAVCNNRKIEMFKLGNC